MALTDLGNDFDKSYTFKDGDLILVTEEDNVIQSIYNRLNTKLQSMDAYYVTYGSNLRGFLGEKKDNRTLGFIKIEVELALKQDPRLQEATVEVEYLDKGGVGINISDIFSEDSDLTLSLVLNNETGVSIVGS